MIKKNEILEKSIEIINNDQDVVFIEDIIADLPCSKATFYELFPGGSDELDYIKDELSKNKIARKKRLRSKWGKSDNATLELALYRLIGTDEERRKLAMNYHELSNPDGTMQPKIIVHNAETQEEIAKMLKNAESKND